MNIFNTKGKGEVFMATKSILKPVTLRDSQSLGNFIAALEKAEAATPKKRTPPSKRVQNVQRENLASFFGKESRAEK